MQAGDTSVDPNDDARKQVVHDHNGRGAVGLDGPVIGRVQNLASEGSYFLFSFAFSIPDIISS